MKAAPKPKTPVKAVVKKEAKQEERKPTPSPKKRKEEDPNPDEQRKKSKAGWGAAAVEKLVTKEEPKAPTPEKPKANNRAVYHQFKNRDNNPANLGTKDIPTGKGCAKHAWLLRTFRPASCPSGGRARGCPNQQPTCLPACLPVPTSRRRV